MKLGAVLKIALLVVLVLGVVAQYVLVRRTQQTLDQITARLVPHGELRYGRVWPFLWGGGRIRDLSFQPEGVLRLGLHAQPGFRVAVQELRLRRLRTTPDGQLMAVHGSAYGVEVPLAALHGIAVAGPAGLPLPSPADLGFDALRFDVDFRIEYVDEGRLAMAAFTAQGPVLGQLHLDVQLEGARENFARAPEQLLMRRLAVEWADGGLAERFRDVAAARARLGRSAWEQAMAAQLDRRAREERWTWDAGTVAALRRLISGADYLRLQLDPPGDVVLRNLRLYALPDWPALLGFELGTEGRFDPPPPQRIWP